MNELIATHHVSFTVADLDRSLGFWRDLLGLPVLSDWVTEAEYLAEITGIPNVQMRICFLELPGSALRLELIQYLRPPTGGEAPTTDRAGAGHLCFDVRDIETLAARLRAAGVRLKSSPVTITSQANYGARALYLTDPDGITLELRQPPGA